MRTQFKWIVASLVLIGACLFAYTRFSTLSSDIQMRKFMEQNRNQIRRTLPRPNQQPPACYDQDCRARQLIFI